MKTETSCQKRLERILRLLQELTLNPRHDRNELMRRLHVGKSAFHADLKLLASGGFSFQWERAKERYRRAAGENHTLPTADLTLNETIGLTLAVQQLAAVGADPVSFDAMEGVRKVIAGAPDEFRRLLQGALDEIFSRVYHAKPKFLDALNDARRRRQLLTIRYRDRSRGNDTRYEIAPYELFFRARAVYLDCEILAERRIATLRVDRILEVGEFGAKFEVAADYDFSERHRHTFRAMRRDETPQEVVMRFAPAVADLILASHWHRSERKGKNPDGSATLSLTISEPKEALWYLAMPYAEHVEIVKPTWLRDEMRRICHLAARRHEAKGAGDE
jgi:predicted DNA-binding transcriptional regulator YafY